MDIAIDLGSSRTRIYVDKNGKVLDEASVAAYNVVFLTGNVCVKYDSSLYEFLINLTHTLIRLFINTLSGDDKK